jgi:hypothetical protein
MVQVCVRLQSELVDRDSVQRRHVLSGRHELAGRCAVVLCWHVLPDRRHDGRPRSVHGGLRVHDVWFVCGDGDAVQLWLLLPGGVEQRIVGGEPVSGGHELPSGQRLGRAVHGRLLLRRRGHAGGEGDDAVQRRHVVSAGFVCCADVSSWLLLSARQRQHDDLRSGSVLSEHGGGAVHELHGGLVLHDDWLERGVWLLFGRLLLSVWLVVTDSDHMSVGQLLSDWFAGSDRVSAWCEFSLPVRGSICSLHFF